MESSDLLIIIFASIGVILGLFFAISLIAVHKKMPKAKLFLALFLLFYSLRFAKSIILYYTPMNICVKNLFLGTLLAVGPPLFFYVKKMLNPLSQVSNQEMLIHWSPFLLFELVSLFFPQWRVTYPMYLGLNFYIAIYASYSLYYVSQKSANATDEVKHWVSILCITTILVVTFSVSLGWLIPLPYIAMTLVYSVAMVFLAFWAIKNLELFKKQLPKYSKSSINTSNVKKYMIALTQLMEEEKLYLNTDLTLSKLSKKMGISTKELSQVINQETKNNYSKYIAKLRVKEAQRLLKEEQGKMYKISSIAYDSGFHSLSSFNSIFKELTGMTASEYRKTA